MSGIDDSKVCRICFDDENKEDLISPCGCKGTMQFVHKECLNSWLANNKSDKRYFQCNECKKDYVRLKPSGQDAAVEFNMAIYTLSLTIFTSLVLVLTLFLCGVSAIICFCVLFILYVMTVSMSVISQNTYSTWFFIVLFAASIFSGRKIRTFVTDIWLILGYGFVSYLYVTDIWDDNKNCIISEYMSKVKPKMYDNYTMKYVDGVI